MSYSHLMSIDPQIERSKYAACASLTLFFKSLKRAFKSLSKIKSCSKTRVHDSAKIMYSILANSERYLIY